MKKLFWLLLSMLWFSFTNAQEEARLLRFPTIYGEHVVFSYAGDLYTVSKEGGIARKLTNDLDGYEMFARFSPDGEYIAFTGQYDGNTEVYVMPAEGGIPVRLTYTATLKRDDISDRMGPNNIVMTWRDDNNIVFRSRKKSFNSFKGHLFIVSKEGGLPEQLPLPSGGFCSYSPDKNKLAYNKVFREFRTWKYYEGGMADDIWIYDFESKQTKNITNNKNQDIFPMWHGDNIYFLSDRNRIMNLFVYDINTGETRALTNYTDYDIKFPSLGNESIIFEKGGYIYNFDLSRVQVTKIPIIIAEDFVSGRDELKDASKLINSYAISPDGKRMVFGARGNVFSVPVKSGITKDLTAASNIHDRNVEWSPDGKYISYISDVTGRDEIYIINQDGNEPPEQLTKNGDTYKYNPIWSPDGTKLLWSDKKLRLQYLDINTKEVILVDKAEDWEIRRYNWSPDSKWITYTVPEYRSATKVWVYNLDTKEKQPVTDEWYDCGSPVFSDDGKYLFFTSSRDFNPIYSWTEWNHAYQDMAKVYLITLTKETSSPFEPENDEVEIKEEEKTKEGKKQDKDNKDEEQDKKKEEVEVEIDFHGITGRVVAVPIDPGRYWNITAIGDNVYYMRNTSKDKKSSIRMYDLEKKKETNLDEFNGYLVSADKKKMVVIKDEKYGVIDLPKSKIKVDEYVDLSNMQVWVNLEEEWKQIFNEAWRQMQDFFYAPNMHGVDWEAIHDKYAPLVPYVNNRNDLNYIIGEMIGELSVGHAYISGGDKPKPKRINTGLLGAELSKDESGYYKINYILTGENWTKNKLSPLTEIGVDIYEGDFILAVNGKPANEMVNIYESLVGKAGKQVELTVNDKPSLDGSRKVIIKPISDESNLYYYNWVQDNIKKVNEATDGQVGYIHIPDMGAGGLNEFVKHFYPQLNKKALIIDDRGNGGGNVSPMIIERLQRELVLMGMSRNTSPSTRPRQVMVGPKVLLIDNYSASDGDLFPYQFKKLGLGTIIGVRSWGGVVGIRGSLPFVDGGTLRRPEFAPYDIDRKGWVIEGYGVDPDIWIDNDPAKEFAGEDEQLNKAIEVILEEMGKYPYKELPPIPPYPDKSK
ncbi:MAG: PDZ domain-containing protein [Bacteroidetes bacterium]|nr:PDZ domain-containing protein [Bacteroidota bacterium]